jgi:hypothetical protein
MGTPNLNMTFEKVNKPPFFATTEDLIWMQIFGGQVIGYESIDVTGGTAQALTVPENAFYAVMTLEGDSAATNPKVCARYTHIAGATILPTPADGVPLGDTGVISVSTPAHLAGFRIIASVPSESHRLTVTYYG